MLLGSQSAVLIKPFTAGAFEVWQDPPRNTLRIARFTANNAASGAPTQKQLYYKQHKETRINIDSYYMCI